MKGYKYVLLYNIVFKTLKINNSIKGIFLFISSAAIFSIMAGMVKTIPHISTNTMVFLRFAIGLGILGGLGITGRIQLKFVNYKLLLLRGISGGFGVFIFFFSILHIGMGKASVYNYAYPIFASVLSIFIIKEKIPVVKWMLILVAFVGICLLTFEDLNEGFIKKINPYELLAIFGTFCSAISIVLVKKLHDTDDSFAIFFSQCIVGFWVLIIPANISATNFQPLDIYILLAIGVLASIAQLLMTEGFRYTTVMTGSSIHLIIPVFNLFIGIIIFNETLTFNEIIGSLIVIVSCFFIISYNRLWKKMKFL